MTRMLRSSALKLAVAYILLGLTALALFATPMWFAWRETIQQGRAEILKADAERLAEIFHSRGPAGLAYYIRQRVNTQIVDQRILLMTAPDSRLLAGNLRSWPAGVPSGTGFYIIPVRIGAATARVAVERVNLPGGYKLLVGRALARFAPLERYFWYALASAVAILSILGILGALLIRRAVMARIHAMRETVTSILQGDLHSRLPVRHSDDELNTLSHTINGMIDQTEQLVDGVRNVSNSIAHDLRTPLAELRTRLEELSLTRPGPDQTRAEIDAAVADVDRVIRIFDALLRLAEMDAGLRRSGFVALDVSSVAAAAVEFYQPAAEVKGMELSLHTDGPAPIRGDPVLLAQALGNLIDNAMKYSAAGATIQVHVLRETTGDVELRVCDTGPGIPAAERDRVVERFYRGDASRGTPGVGLGLSLVEAVARLHGTRLTLEDNQPGLRASLRLRQDARLTARLMRAATPNEEPEHELVNL